MKNKLRKLFVVIVAIVLMISATQNTNATVSQAKMSKSQYKKKCKTMYYKKIFFSKKNLKGKYVKLYCYIEDGYRMDIFDTLAHEFADKYKLSPQYRKAGVRHKKNKSYAVASIDLYFPKKGKPKYSNFKAGEYVTVYGKIIDYSTLTWSGYNTCRVKAKYIEKRSSP